MQVEFGVIGGTGLYDPKLLKNIQEITIDTPYGKPSDAFTIGELGGKSVAFLPRHGKLHTIRPTDLNQSNPQRQHQDRRRRNHRYKQRANSKHRRLAILP